MLCLHCAAVADTRTPMHNWQIIMPTTACENGKQSHLYTLLSERFTDTDLVTVQRKYFNEAKGVCTHRHRRACVCDE